ncbi:MAG: nucleoside triphosphate pyrophosphohydrolase [Proteobacteria bacterium]|nr:nucleoside triphosphate pyrophosphohydrolase [Pseudomonadota bacterium]
MSHALPPIDRLRAVMAKLRDRRSGCPWDVEQTFATIAPYTIEEAYEVADAIERNDMAALKDELGDLLFQVIFHARMAEEASLFDFDAIATHLSDKMVRRHPHVFGDAVVRDTAAQTEAWEAHKAAERRAADSAAVTASALDGVPVNLPALARAQKLQKRAARVGFDWPDIAPALDKISEEIGEFRAELDRGAAAERLQDEIGDLLFACVNVARFAGIDAETALRAATAKFDRRFRRVEALLAARGKRPEHSTLAEMDALWNVVKAEESST